MNEEQFQMGIRDLSKHDLVRLVLAYRDECMTSGNIFKDYAENNLAQQPLHKVVSARKYARISTLCEDFNVILREKE